ncbi:ras-related protein rab-30 [Stylonychia lemnae]|uniref:Ras-related protein rab-30 n=1 Tax=Stylonychia lemnae TaxID=5949 RepID=A0A078ANJ3_STYLE|nr:ras-related protein rab-30 [Stylonychia lemnae]|eukprot:CDW83910.1 ras-related protein rab-30 [Stylonychia lemnae]
MVGKTSIIQRFIDNMFVDNNGTAPTLAWDFKVKTLQVEGDSVDVDASQKEVENVRLYVWDTAGQERFRHIARMYYKDVSGVLLCFDLTDEESFKNVNFWLSDLNKHAPSKLVKVLVGNKCDLCLSNQAKSSNPQMNIMYYYECSAKTGKNVNEIFQKLVNEINTIAKQNINMRIEFNSDKAISVLDEALDRRGPGKKLKGERSSSSGLEKKKSKCC